jgi:uncharacterized protein YebE (UPF0316 family)
MLATLLGALLVFALRVTDVTIGTIRTILMIRGRRLPAVALGLVESGVFVFAITRVMVGLNENPWKMLGYAAGFATGTFLGMTLERIVAGGWVLVRVASRDRCDVIAGALRREHFGVTMLRGEGKEGEIGLLFIVAPRRRGEQLLKLVEAADAEAFVIVEPVQQAIGGYIPHAVSPNGIKK